MFLREVWRTRSLRILDQRTRLNRQGQHRARHFLTEAELTRAIALSWRRETSDDPRRWSPDNPARGQCAVTALIVQDFFGGDLLCSSINLTPHYWNLLPNRCELDLTRGQFKKVAISGVPYVSARQRVLSSPETRRNYRRLRKLVRGALQHRAVRDFQQTESADCPANRGLFRHSTVTLFARFRGWSTSQPRSTAM